MSKMAEPFSGERKTTYSLVLLILSCCLVAHFLVEDVSLQRAMNSSAQSPSTAGLAFDEMEHQDDLAMAAVLPDPVWHNAPPAILAWSLPVERQFAFPIRIPPKIA